ncbi:SixA phosphatase family protein [Rhodococcus sp. NPDC003318]|uniref:SixA phosphatase family protein n=1 Tax=Rhodococcus sp. NPDC003318 TaxID=3364503 RepID=UPI0036B2325A
MFVLVRHADAVAKKAWRGPDVDRPLSPLGHQQSAHIVDALADVALSELISSPTVRCRQTLQPLAAARGLPIVDDPRLARDASVGALLSALGRCDDGVLWCTHGELFDQLAAAATEHDAAPFLPTAQTAKGGVWIVHRDRGPRYVGPIPPG